MSSLVRGIHGPKLVAPFHPSSYSPGRLLSCHSHAITHSLGERKTSCHPARVFALQHAPYCDVSFQEIPSLQLADFVRNLRTANTSLSLAWHVSPYSRDRFATGRQSDASKSMVCVVRAAVAAHRSTQTLRLRSHRKLKKVLADQRDKRWASPTMSVTVGAVPSQYIQVAWNNPDHIQEDVIVVLRKVIDTCTL